MYRFACPFGSTWFACLERICLLSLFEIPVLQSLAEPFYCVLLNDGCALASPLYVRCAFSSSAAMCDGACFFTVAKRIFVLHVAVHECSDRKLRAFALHVKSIIQCFVSRG